MSAFLWVCIALCGLSAIGKLMWLKDGAFPERTPRSEVADVVQALALIAWAAYLLGSA